MDSINPTSKLNAGVAQPDSERRSFLWKMGAALAAALGASAGCASKRETELQKLGLQKPVKSVPAVALLWVMSRIESTIDAKRHSKRNRSWSTACPIRRGDIIEAQKDKAMDVAVRAYA